MRIAIVCGAGIVSGKEIMALELGEGLRDSGIEVHFVTSRWGNGEFGRQTEAAGFPTYRLWLGFISAALRLDAIWMTLDQLGHWPSLITNYRRFIREVRPDRIIHTNWHHALLLWPWLHEERDIFWLHEVIPTTPRFRYIFNRLFKGIGCFVAVSQVVARSLTAIGVPHEKVRVVYNGLRDPADDARADIQNGSEAVGIVGQIAPWKGHEDLLKAFQIVCHDHPSARMNVFGEGLPDYESKLRELARQFGIDRKVTWNGFVRDRSEIYRRLAVLVVPSQSADPLPTTAIEAGFFGIPVVASRRGGLTEIIEDGLTGYLFEPGDTEGLAQHILALLRDAGLREKLGRNARSRASSLFGRDRFVRDFADLLQVENMIGRQDGHSIKHFA